MEDGITNKFSLGKTSGVVGDDNVLKNLPSSNPTTSNSQQRRASSCEKKTHPSTAIAPFSSSSPNSHDRQENDLCNNQSPAYYLQKANKIRQDLPKLLEEQTRIIIRLHYLKKNIHALKKELNENDKKAGWDYE